MSRFIIANDDGDYLGEFTSRTEADCFLHDWLLTHDDEENTTNYEIMDCEEE